MSTEGLPAKQSSKAELLRAEEAHEAADPTTFSELPMSGDKVDLGKAAEGYGNQLVGNNGEKYVKLEGGSSDSAQFVTSKLLKGIINVSDIVKDGKGDYYSKVMPLEKIQAATSASEMDADFFVIKALTGDGDRDFIPAADGREQYAKNLAHEDGKVAYFDFGYARQLTPSINTAEQAAYANLESMDAAAKKLDAIYTRMSGTMGTAFLKAILKESGQSASEAFPAFEGTGTDEESLLALQAALLIKVQEAQGEIRKRSAKQRAAA